MNKIITVLLINLFIISCSSYCKSTNPYLNGMNELPNNNISKLTGFGSFDDKAYRVNSDGSVQKGDEGHSPQITLETNKGILIGIDAGEFGGKLTFKDKSGVENLVLNDNVKNIIQFDNSIYISTGLAHLMTNKCELIKLHFSDGTYKIDKSFTLSGAPAAFFIKDEFLYMLTFGGIDKLNNDKLTNILSNQKWGILYPSSLFVDDCNIVIGARGCLIVIDKSTLKIKSYR